MLTQTKLKKVAREAVLNPREHVAIRVIADMNDPGYCHKRAIEELQNPHGDPIIAINLLLIELYINATG